MAILVSRVVMFVARIHLTRKQSIEFVANASRFYRFGYTTPDPFPIAQLIADFRSDTVTRPTEEMKKAMFDCEDYGDNVYDEDVAVIELENKLAKLADKEAGLFCASGTMANQIALRCQLGSLESLIVDKRAHIFRYEAGGVAYHSQAQVVPLQGGLHGKTTISPETITENIFGFDVHNAVTKGVALENTIQGLVIPLKEILEIKEVCKKNDLFLHLDGARIANACVKAGLSLGEFVQPFDTVSVCLSKSLGCPIGSVILGPKNIIQKAKHYRKLLGGGWRQAGMLAAAGIYALDHHWDRLAVDHDNASFLAAGLQKLGFQLLIPTETNQVWIDSSPLGITFDDLAKECRKFGVIIPNGASTCRLVTHLQTTRSNCETLLSIISQYLQDRQK